MDGESLLDLLSCNGDYDEVFKYDVGEMIYNSYG
jgi:hypothetical protein